MLIERIYPVHNTFTHSLQDNAPKAIGDVVITCDLYNNLPGTLSQCSGVIDIDTNWSKKSPDSALAFSFVLDAAEFFASQNFDIKSFVATGSSGLWLKTENIRSIDFELVVSP